jgi:SulP family sulfate permease
MRLRLHRDVQPAINTPIATRLYRFDRIRCSNKGGLYFLYADLIAAIATGVVMAALAFVKQMADAQLKNFGGELPVPDKTTPEEKALLEDANGKMFLFDFGGPLSFGAAADGATMFASACKWRSQKRGYRSDFTSAPFIDVSAARAVETACCRAKAAGRRVFMSGINDEVRQMLSGLNADHCLPKRTYFPTRVEALAAAVEYVKQNETGTSQKADVESDAALTSA